MRNRMGNVLWGIFFIVLGIGFAGQAFDLWSFNLFFRGWWTLFIIVPCLISIFKSGFRVVPVCGLVIGVLFLFSSIGIFRGVAVGRLIFPIILIVIGLGIIFRHSFPSSKFKDKINLKPGDLQHTATFSSEKIAYNNEVFTGASLDAIFGGVELNLSNAIINSDVVINCNAVFGGIDIMTPQDVNIKVASTPIFGGVDNKRRNTPVVHEAPTIYVNATCMFGGVDIK